MGVGCNDPQSGEPRNGSAAQSSSSGTAGAGITTGTGGGASGDGTDGTSGGGASGDGTDGTSGGGASGDGTGGTSGGGTGTGGGGTGGGGTGGGTGGGGTGGAVDDEFLLTLSFSLDPMRPFVFLTQLTTRAGGGGVELWLDLQPLRAADRRTPTGAPTEAGPFLIEADGHFEAEVLALNIPHDADPISDLTVEADLTLSGTVSAPGNFICGEVTGTVTQPITLDVAGSTFTLQRINDPAVYPAAFINCAMIEAPLP